MVNEKDDSVTIIPSNSHANGSRTKSFTDVHFSRHKPHISVSEIIRNQRLLSVIDPMSDRVSTILVWKNLTVSARDMNDNRSRILHWNHKPKIKYLLSNISGAVTGGLWAVMGPSGSGKSTLLNTLACRLDVSTNVSGEMHLNGAPYNNAELKRIAGYVMKDDLLNGFLTVEETLTYTARFRLHKDSTEEERKQRVKEVMADMGLSHVHNVIIGTSEKKGISGGERKRVSVGMELLSRPQLLFLDEPVSNMFTRKS
ncbi:unnamed protein product [Didymodactylos carnosus]|uniref:ABC transporter domain-containing protein n=1 Tax=Didymodactylos carnosus TaxID=1234261 RepID=A0A815KJM4_9BILA|nr:unnamed protein product [Didymodactylos carnosus]CAF4288106.1 unnamed protein product [Didymodactylos carnosus]